ncbi:MAG: hypothetical protein U1D55_19310 [Phycisphaerae bacterium]
MLAAFGCLAVALLGMPPAARAQNESDERELRVYDVRDLQRSLSVANPRTQPSTLDMPRPDAGDSTDAAGAILDELCSAIGIGSSKLYDSIYAIEASSSEHQKLTQLLSKVRALHRDRFEVDLVIYPTSADAPPAIGDAAEVKDPRFRRKLVVARDQDTPVISVRQIAYVAGLSPVVAESAVGYDPRGMTAEEGLRAVIAVSGGDEPKSAILLHVRGELASVSLRRGTGPGDVAERSDEKGCAPRSDWQLDLPEIARRDLRGDLRLTPGKLTVIEVLDGFEAGHSIVVAAALRPLPE